LLKKSIFLPKIEMFDKHRKMAKYQILSGQTVLESGKECEDIDECNLQLVGGLSVCPFGKNSNL